MVQLRYTFDVEGYTMGFRAAMWLAASIFALGCSGGTVGDDDGAGPGGNGDGTDTGEDPNGDGDGTDGDGPACEEHVVNGSRGVPNVLIVLDRSGSMKDDGRWGQAVGALKSVVSNLDTGIAFGLMMFPGPGGGESCDAGAMSVMPAVGMGDAIAGALETTWPNGGTPTAPSLAIAKDVLAGVAGQSYVLLVTDGAPNCNAGLDPNHCEFTGFYGSEGCLDDTRSVGSVAELAAANIPTYVIGFDTDAWSDVLSSMASAGATGQDYFPVDNGTSLESTLSELAGNVVSCSFELDSAPSDFSYVHVTLDGADVPHVSTTQDGSGWELLGSRIELRGSSCDGLKGNEDAELGITVECTPVIL